MIQLRFVPCEKWSGERTKSRRYDQFRSTYVQTLDLLEQELNYLRAREIVLQAFISWQDLRNDGLPRSDAKFVDPGVILTFDSASGPLSFPCDRYTDWQANLRAIALWLEALRAVNRYGVTRHAEQYQGWKKLAAPNGPAPMVRDEAAAFVASHSGAPEIWPRVKADKSVRDDAYRLAARACHPDGGGTHERFVKLQEAMRILEGK